MKCTRRGPRVSALLSSFVAITAATDYCHSRWKGSFYLPLRTPRDMRPSIYLLLILLALAGISPAFVQGSEPTAQKDAAALFEKVEKILHNHCIQCHGPEKQRNDLRLDRASHLLKGGTSGAVVKPGKSEESLLVQLISGKDPERIMPAKGPRLPEAEIKIIREWIDAGAQIPKSQLAEERELHWSLKPLRKIELPELQKGGHANNQIDHFILAELDKRGMAPSPPADKQTLLRRLYFNLTGLPPTESQVAAYAADESAAATARVIDHLLESPRYGERWARHWLDLAHYAETHGHDQDRPRTHAWPYRDYVIASFNTDKPYARFAQEQVAGDVLFPNNPEATAALGFLATGPWDESSLRDIREDTLDRQIARYLDRDDIVMTVMNTFVSSTAQCARCHNHKFDPISQADYYNLQAIFAATDKGNKLYDPDPKTAAKRKSLSERKTALQQRSELLKPELLAPEFQAKAAKWADVQKTNSTSWIVLKPSAAITTNKSELEIKEDGSVFAGGKRPETDTYFISAPVKIGATALRLEVLSDEALPMKGPGRQDNGNLHLTNFKVFFTPEGSTNAVLITLQNPTADWNQEGWDITKAIDADPKTAWGIYPKVGQSHQGVFEFKEKLLSAGKIEAVFEQNHGGGHLIGKLRLSLTESPLPVRINSLPDEIANILALAEAEWTEKQQQDLAFYLATLENDTELKKLPEQKLVYAGTSDFVPDASFKPAGKPREVRLLKRGDIKQPGAEAIPAAPGFISDLPGDFSLDAKSDEGARRAKLALWLTDPKNVLAWRSIVNRVWQYHFGAGLVTTPSDFGKMGSAPSHPELLDWLANWFIENGGSFKNLHRLILNSAAYQQSSQTNPKYAEMDADNRLLWRMNRTRLDAETVRDSMVFAAGKLDFKMGGPSVQQFVMTPGIHVTPNIDYTTFNVDAPGNYRRSIYRFIFRTLPDPFMDALDCPDSSQLTPTRNSSVTVSQALAMLNDKSVIRLSELFAERIENLRLADAEGEVNAALQIAFGRLPGQNELVELVKYRMTFGLANLCRVIFNSNEFLFVN